MIYFVDILFIIGMLIFLGAGAYGLGSWLADNIMSLIIGFGIAIGIVVLWFKALFRWPEVTFVLTAIIVSALVIFFRYI